MPDPEPLPRRTPRVAAAPADALPPEEQAASTDLFCLDLDAQKPGEPPSEVGPLVALTPLLDEVITKPAKNGRPPIKITYVRPGGKSPFKN